MVTFDDEWRQLVNASLDRMKRASNNGTGCHLTKEMVQALRMTIIGQAWEDRS